MKDKALYYIDGGSRNNPGEAGIGVVEIIENVKKGYYQYKGILTNNEAEYNALLKALSLATEKKIESVEIFTDSELVCNQINGEYKVKNEKLKELFTKAKELIKKIKNFSITHIPREKNKEADKLVNLAIDLKNNGER